MCGLVGFFGGDWSSGADAARAMLLRMAGCISHRGPDGTAAWLEGENRVALGHNRLAILDLSAAGDQPMHSASGRYVIVYNGEIYNHLELRERLTTEGRAGPWRGHSDTETLLAAVEAWGIRTALERAIGMFAIALWDREAKELILARDRLGEKPLYYGWQGNGRDRVLLFGSELKSLGSHPSFRRKIDREALALYMRHAYVPAPWSIFQGIKKLLPGSFLTFGPGGAERLERYWSGAEVAAAGAAAPRLARPEDYVDQLEPLLTDAVGKQMLSDVPLGAFLSGGVDSSTVVALMQAQSARPVRTFSIGFHEEAYNEAEHAKAVARHLGTDHTELYVTAQEAMSVVPQLPTVYDEPFADSSQIPTLLVSRLARQHVTVSLSGDAGDELFAGYNRYKMTAAHWRRMSRLPRPLRAGLARSMRSLSPAAWDRIASAASPILPQSLRMSLPGEKIIKAASVLPSRSSAELYGSLISIWRDPSSVVLGAGQSGEDADANGAKLAALGDVERMMASDMLGYLPDDILVKVDRAAMSVSLETRVPFLDHRVVEFAWSIPIDVKMRGGETKWPLRQLLYRHVPRQLIERPKMGFGVPIDSWLRGPLKAWAEDLLDEERIRREGYLNPEPIRRAWADHQSGRANLQHQLWTVLMFQSWLAAVPQQSSAQSTLSPSPFENRATPGRLAASGT